jgi:hypothetical protein
MQTIAHRQKSHRDAGALNERIAMTGFVDEPTESTFMTKAAAVGRVYRLKGVDHESAEHAKRALVVHRLEAALRACGPGFRVREYFLQVSGRALCRAAVPAPGGGRGHPAVDGRPQSPASRPLHDRPLCRH